MNNLQRRHPVLIWLTQRNFKNRLFLKYIVLIMTLLITNTFSSANSLTKEEFKPDRSIVYKSINDIDLSLHIFNPEDHKTTAEVPVIVFFFGGGWAGGSPRQFYEQSRYFAEKGIVAISAEYRVKNKHKTSPYEAVSDAKSVIRWVRENAEELGINPNKIVASGGSAGGHVAACTGLIEGYEEEGEDLEVSSKPNAMILYNPVLDTTEKGYGMSKVGKVSKTAISPNHHVVSGIVPTIVFHGRADKTVPFENAVRFDSLMSAAGNESSLEAYNEKGHGFFNGPFFRGEKADRQIYNDIQDKSYAFLVSKLMDVRPSKLFTDHMVLQQRMKIPVWGEAKPGQEVTVKFDGQSKSAITDDNGKWGIVLDELKASKTGRELTIVGEDKIVISDVLVGEVWICSGQSNMQMSYEKIPEIKALRNEGQHIRSFEVKRTVSFHEEDDVIGKWSDHELNSAVAFSFANFLELAGDLPVGIIHASWGSSSIEAWMPRDMAEEFEDFNTIMKDFDADEDTRNRIQKIVEKKENRSTKEDIFLRRQPNILYNAMMKPLAPYAVRGLVWYQGERNTRYLSGMPSFNKETWFHRVAGMKEYGDLLNAWVLRYRQEWQKEDMHFMIVMLPGYGKGTINKPEIDPLDPSEDSWAWFRESQLKVLDLPNTSVINTIDLGDVKDIHPKDKLPIGQRLAWVAAHKTLGQNIASEGPFLANVEKGRRKLTVSFTNAGGLKTIDGMPPRGFWIADESMQWKPADASIKKGRVVLKSAELKRPIYIRYAFSGKPDVNLVNAAGLPVYPFRTDQ